jgi:hypothetical protein
MLRPHLTLLFALALSAGASAQITPTGPFVGGQSDGFETQGFGGFFPCIANRVFNNTADLCTPGNSGCNITGSWGFSCSIFPHSGIALFGSAQGYAEYTFDVPAQRFGGYFGVNWQVGDGTAIFFDSNGAQIGSQVITAPPNCTWNWNGWDAGAGPLIKRVAIYGPITWGGPFMMLDDMEVDYGSSGPGTDLCDPGTGGTMACPCSNPPTGGSRGCDNSSTTGGAQLSSTGNASLAGDTVVFATAGEKPTATSILLQGNAVIASGITFGQGVRCAGGTLKRLYVKTASGGSITAPGPGDPSVSAQSAALNDPISAGTMRWYSVYYRDPIVLGSCPATSTFNITQTQEVTWGP